jgi:hypothetical protein
MSKNNDSELLELAKSWSNLAKAIGTMLVAQPYQISEASSNVENLCIRHNNLFEKYTNSVLFSTQELTVDSQFKSVTIKNNYEEKE